MKEITFIKKKERALRYRNHKPVKVVNTKEEALRMIQGFAAVGFSCYYIQGLAGYYIYFKGNYAY